MTTLRTRPKLQTRDLRGVEILAPGTWTDSHGHTDGYTVDDLQSICRAFSELRDTLKPYGKLGHDKGQKLAQADGYPAIGYVDNLYVTGDKLVADFVDIPAKVADLIEARAYDTVSSEVYFDLELNGKTYDHVLRAVAFLGANMPAVKDLKSISDVANLYRDAFAGAIAHYAEYDSARNLEWGDDLPPSNVTRTLMTAMEQALQLRLQGLVRYGVISDEEEDAIQDLYEQLEESMTAQLDPNVKTRPVLGKIAAGMYAEGDEDTAISELCDYMTRLEERIKGVSGARTLRTFLGATLKQLSDMRMKPANKQEDQQMDLKELAEMVGLPATATEAEVKAKLATLNTAAGQVTELSETVKTMNQTVAQIQQERTSERVYAEVETAIREGKLLPAQRESMRAYATTDIEGFRNLVKATPRLTFLSSPIGSDGIEAPNGDPENPTPIQQEVSRQLGTNVEMRKLAERDTGELMREHAAKVNAKLFAVPSGAA